MRVRPRGGEIAGGCSLVNLRRRRWERWSWSLNPTSWKGNSALCTDTHTVTHRPLHLPGLSRPQIREGWCSHNPLANVWRLIWAPNLPQPKQISGIFHRPRPPWFGLRMWKTSSLTPTTIILSVALSDVLSTDWRCLRKHLHYSKFGTSAAFFSHWSKYHWCCCVNAQLGFTQQHHFLETLTWGQFCQTRFLNMHEEKLVPSQLWVR